MSFVLSFDNPIGFAQVRVRGGWKNVLTTTAAYVLILGSTMFATASLAAVGTSNASIYGGWVYGLMGLQTAVLLLFGATRVSAAIRGDLLGMIESHRLMPVEASQAVLGYLGGSTCQALALAAANVVLGAVAVGRAGLPLDRWIGFN